MADAPALEGRCAGGRLTLAAVDAPAGKVFRLLAEECGVELRRADLLPDEPVTASYRDLPLEEAIRDLLRLAGTPGTLRVSSATGALTVYFMPVGAEGTARVSAAAAGGAGRAPGDTAPESGPGAPGKVGESGAAMPRGDAGGAATDQALPWQQAIAALARLSADEAWVLRNLDPQDFAEERRAALAAEARRRFLLGEDQADRLEGLRDLGQLDPAEAAELAGADAEGLDVLREERIALEARTAFLLAETPEDRERTLARLRLLDPFEAGELQGLTPEALDEERREAAKERARSDYSRSLAPEEQLRLFREIQKRLPD